MNYELITMNYVEHIDNLWKKDARIAAQDEKNFSSFVAVFAKYAFGANMDDGELTPKQAQDFIVSALLKRDSLRKLNLNTASWDELAQLAITYAPLHEQLVRLQEMLASNVGRQTLATHTSAAFAKYFCDLNNCQVRAYLIKRLGQLNDVFA